MFPWETYKRSFDLWEKHTAQLMETWLQSPVVLEPAGSVLTTMLKAKAAGDRVLSRWWTAMGLPTRRDQERALHTLNELESRLLDLEERLSEEE